MAQLLFHRNYRGFTGGHLKVWDYFEHAGQSEFEPRIYFTAQSLWDAENPWFGCKPAPLERWDPWSSDALFLAGLDWLAVPEGISKPVINLIQGVRHASPDQRLYQFLSRRAVRICVSPEVAEAVAATGRVNGPIFTIPNAIAEMPAPAQQRDVQLLICGAKQPQLARELAQQLAGIESKCLTDKIPRAEFLQWLGRSQVALLLPLEAEGFYLPALEAMAMGTLVVCPDCVGNRSFCLDGINCLRPAYERQAIALAAHRALSMPEPERSALLRRAADQVRLHSKERERESFLKLLGQLPSLL